MFSRHPALPARRPLLAGATALLCGLLLSQYAAGGGTGEVAEAMHLMRPDAVALLVHREVADRRFLPILVQRLEETLAPPVRQGESDLDLAPFRGGFGPIEVGPLLQAIASGVDWPREPRTVVVVIIPDDIRSPPARFNFAVSTGGAATPVHLTLVSLARLQDRTRDGVDRSPERTAERVHKLVAKNTAKLAGYTSSTLCVFGFPRSLGELDAMPEGFCEPDLSALATAGIARGR